MSKKKKEKELKKLESLLTEQRNKDSQYLFNKDYSELNIAEQIKYDQFIRDVNNPQWKRVFIKGEGSEYEISNTGILIYAGDIIEPKKTDKGYLGIRVYYGENEKYSMLTSIHRLVAEAFIPNPENKPQVNHINGKKDCNWVGNLEWVTAKENIQHAMENGLFHIGLGEKANASKYTEKQVHEVCRLLQEGKLFNTEIAKITGVDVSNVSKIKIGQIWQHVSSQYNIKKPVQNATGSAAAASKYTEEDIHKVCKLLEEGKMNMMDISKATNVSYNTIWRVKYGTNWREVSSQYKIKGLDGINSPKNFMLKKYS